jgi:hypothetical protein
MALSSWLHRELVTCNDFDDDKDEIVGAGVDFIGNRSICGYYLQGLRYSWALPVKEIRHLNLMNYWLEVFNLQSILYLMIQPPMFFHRLRCVLV